MEQAINNFLDNKVASMSPEEVTKLLSPDGTTEGLKLNRDGGGFTEVSVVPQKCICKGSSQKE